MKHIKYVALLIFAILYFEGNTQEINKYWVFFTDKEGVEFDPYAYFDPLAIERRKKQNLPLYDNSDLPLREDYISFVENVVDSIKGHSRWFNAICVFASEEQIDKVKNLPCVKEIESIESNVQLAHRNEVDHLLEALDNGTNNAYINLVKSQTELMGISKMRENNWKGKGMRIAIFDAGFPNVDILDAFEHIRERNGIKATFDFVKNNPEVYRFNAHGTMTFSCVAGMYKGIPMGFATDAEFLLARTERATFEKFSEEEGWVMAAEWADKNGAHVINSSLGYTNKRYFQDQMDGKSSLVSRAANKAAKKGMLVVNSAGNEGSGDWKIIGAPADADSVLTVGGFNPWTGMHTEFGSYGPTADGRMKPNVTAVSSVIAQGKNGYESTQGTSFSSPLVAGFAAAFWGANQELKVMEVFDEMCKSGHLFPYFDYAHGFGVPQAAAFFDTIAPSGENPIHIVEGEDEVFAYILPNYFVPHFGTFNIEGGDYFKHPDDSEYRTHSSVPLMEIPPFFYWHTESKDHQLREYHVIQLRNPDEYIMKWDKAKIKGKILRCYYRGNMYEKQF